MTSYRFKLESTVGENVRQILSEQLEKARIQLDETFIQQPAEAIHDARKRLKKSRSLLRLVRKSLGKGTYKQEKNCLRDIGRELAIARSGEAYQETLEQLLNQYDHMLDATAFADLQASLVAFHNRQLRAFIDEAEPLVSVVFALKDSRTRLQDLQLAETGWEALRKNLKRNYRQGRERFAGAYEAGSDRAFHEWRKRVKDLWYDLRLLKVIWPEVMTAFEAEVHQLSKYLGDDHDIAELRQFLQGADAQGKVSSARESQEAAVITVKDSQISMLLPLMAERQHALRQQAKVLGDRLYAEPPDAFIKRIEHYWYSSFSA